MDVEGHPFAIAYMASEITEGLASKASPFRDSDAVEDGHAIRGVAGALFGMPRLAAAKHLMPAMSIMPLRHPWYMDVAHDALHILSALDSPARALTLAKKLRGDAPEVSRLAVLESQFLMRAGRQREALVVALDAVHQPDIPWLGRWNYLHILRMSEEAAPGWRGEVLPLPDAPCPRRWAGLLAEELVLVGDAEHAQLLLDGMGHDVARDARDLWTQGIVLHLRGKSQEAVALLKAAVLDGSAPAGWFSSLGDALVAQGDDLRGAEAAYSVACKELKPSGHPLSPYLGRAWVRALVGDHDGAFKDVRLCLDAAPTQVAPWIVLGRVSIKARRSDELQQAIESLRKLDPNAAKALHEEAERAR